MTATPPARAGAIRASDQDRNAAVSSLSEHYAQGRLDLAEFELRMDSAQRATYLDDLAALFTDLPAQRSTAAREPRRVRGHRDWLPYLVLAVAALTILAVSHGHVPWLLVPLLWFVAVRHLVGHRSWQHTRVAARRPPWQP